MTRSDIRFQLEDTCCTVMALADLLRVCFRNTGDMEEAELQSHLRIAFNIADSVYKDIDEAVNHLIGRGNDNDQHP